MTDSTLWEQQPLETDAAFAAFCRYRDAGPRRSILGLSKALDIKRGQLTAWAERYSWKQRVMAFTREQDRIGRVQHQEALRAMADSHLELSQELIKKGMARLAELDPSELRPGEAARFIQLGVDMEQRARAYVVEPQTAAQAVLEPLEQAVAKPVEPDEGPLSFEDALRAH